MKETGTVTKISSGNATVKVKRRAECSKCGMCGMKDSATDMDFVASLNSAKVNVGDVVVIENKKDLKFLSYLLIFIVPLVLIGLGLFIGYTLLNETFVLLISLGSVVVWYGVIYFVDKIFRFGKNYGYQITEVLKSVSLDDKED